MSDPQNDPVPGARAAGDVLRSDPLYRLAGSRLATPAVLGTVLFLIAIAIVVLGPSSESRFIYTDF